MPFLTKLVRPSSSIRLALCNGVLSNSIENRSIICPTGNCNWPIIPTVRVCGACANITYKIVYHRSSSSSCTLSLGGLNLTGSCNSDSLDFAKVFTIRRGSGYVFESLTNKHIQANSPNMITDFSALGLSPSRSLSSGLEAATATECALWYCLEAHNVSVNRGQLQDITVNTWSKTKHTKLGGNVTFVDVPVDMNADPADVYAISASQMLAMSTFTNNTLTGSVKADRNALIIVPSSDYADGIHKGFENVDEWIGRLTRGMTNEMRLNVITNMNETRYHGTAYADQSVLVVRWPWITFPMTLVILSTGYLIFEIAHTSTLNVQPWKADSLLPIHVQLGSELAALAAHDINEPEGIRKRIGGHRVRLSANAGRIHGFA